MMRVLGVEWCPLKSYVEILLPNVCECDLFGNRAFSDVIKLRWNHTWLVEFSCSIMSNSLWSHGLQHTRLPCPSLTPRSYSNSCPSSQWSYYIFCHPLLLPPFFPSIRVFSNESVLHTGGQSIGVSASASVLPMNIQDWFPLGLTGWISLQSKVLSRVFSNTAVQKHQFFSTQLSL